MAGWGCAFAFESEPWSERERGPQVLEVTCPCCAALCPLQYASRVRTIKNDVSKNENSKEVLKLRKMIDYWKEQVRRLGREGCWDLMHVKEVAGPRKRLCRRSIDNQCGSSTLAGVRR